MCYITVKYIRCYYRSLWRRLATTWFIIAEFSGSYWDLEKKMDTTEAEDTDASASKREEHRSSRELMGRSRQEVVGEEGDMEEASRIGEQRSTSIWTIE